MNKQYYNDLFERLLNGKLSPEETDQLLEWLNQEGNASEAASIISSRLSRPVTEEEITPEIRSALQARLPLVFHAAKRQERGLVQLLHHPAFKYAAAAVLILAIGSFLWSILLKPIPAVSPDKPIVTKTDIAPGTEGAILTLADGRKVVLDSLGNGIVADQTGTEVRLQDGKLIYDPTASTAEQVAYNAISTPKGRQFQLILPDQTKVWLNAASSIKYPTRFSGNNRRVEIIGEAYFEVTKDKTKPFIVDINGRSTVEVLGTHFNINGYDNEPAIKTTLLEGSVKVESAIPDKSGPVGNPRQVGAGRQSAILKPGEQAVLASSPLTTDHSPLTIDHSPNIDKVMAWKNGVFNFEEATLQEVMHQLERWYDIEVQYETGIPKLEFVGKMGRDLSLNNVLRGLELSKVHFRLEGRKLIVLP